ncbi:glycosyltransferase family 2 protein [Desulfovibrio gilichinskyi]|uniref:Glycosyl transferase family 2 n=1 Tax=Desulfovibrio gilichinskyi TaxID=1519643 RepID=A0A1X7EUJ5_9BACT|nr:glycosyltransferase family 2 protein [Desulfovibrio gilichinskyi]SMF39923.1 Glycosyl transferase family 2 [Desulfovibrio gilichinskyi]
MSVDKNNYSPEISIIIPTYNRSEMLCRAVRSVLGQSFTDFECLIVNDGSTDDTAQTLETYTDSRIKVLFQENRGVSAARNLAIKESTGKYIALLDSDDEWLPKKLEMQLAFMRSENLDISQTNEIWVRNDKRVNQSKKYAKPSGMFFDRSLETCLISPSCAMFNKKFWDSVGPFDENMPACEDYDLWIRSGFKFPVGLLEDKLTIKYGGRPDQLTNSVACFDLYRIYSIIKLLHCNELSLEELELAKVELQRKAGYFVGGCKKRGKFEQAEKVEQMVKNVLEGQAVIPIEILPVQE